jgi:hypothetical protein
VSSLADKLPGVVKFGDDGARAARPAVVWEDLADDVTIRLERVAALSGSIRGEITVERSGVELVAHRRIDCQSSSNIDAVVRDLNRHDKAIPWAVHVQKAAADAVKEYRAVAGMVNAWDMADEGPPAALVGGLWPNTTRPCLFYGDSEACKTILATASLLSVASGVEVIPGEPPVSVGPTAFLDWEDDRRTFVHRLRRLAAGVGVDIAETWPVLYFSPGDRRPLHQIADSLAGRFDAEGVIAAVVDSRGAASGGSLNDDEATNGFFNAVASLGTATAIVDHVGKAALGPHSSTAHHSFGSVFTRARVASSWKVAAVDLSEGKRLTLTDSKWSHGPRRPARTLDVRFGFDSIIIERATGEAPATVTGATVADRILTALEDTVGGLTPGDLAERLDVKDATVRKGLQRLAAAAKVHKVRDRYIRLPELFDE